MTLEPDDAAHSLSEIAAVERRTRQTLAYGRSSAAIILWGVLLVFGYTFGFAFPDLERKAWFAVIAMGFAGCTFLGSRRSSRAGRSPWDQPILFGQLVLYAYGWMFVTILWPLAPRQLNAFWPNVFMLGFALAGLWLGRAFLLLGLSVTALTLVGYFWSGPWFGLWMAVVGGGGLIAGGLWLRRLG